MSCTQAFKSDFYDFLSCPTFLSLSYLTLTFILGIVISRLCHCCPSLVSFSRKFHNKLLIFKKNLLICSNHSCVSSLKELFQMCGLFNGAIHVYCIGQINFSFKHALLSNVVLLCVRL
jgi:hypothetical protein